LLFTLEKIAPTRNISTALYSNLHNTPIYVFNVDMCTLGKCFISNCSRSLHTRTTYLLLICGWTRLM
jgi:hypothetical protein